MAASLSILRADRSHSFAQVIGRLRGRDAAWLEEHLRDLEGDVTLDCSRLRLAEPTAAAALVDFDRFLVRRGRRLHLRGLTEGTRRAIQRIERCRA